jgi:hypothetical protein
MNARAGQAAGKRALPALAAEFLENLRVEGGASALTGEAYGRDLGRLAAFLAARRRTLDSARPADLVAHLEASRARGLGPRTVARSRPSADSTALPAPPGDDATIPRSSSRDPGPRGDCPGRCPSRTPGPSWNPRPERIPVAPAIG